MTSELEAMKAIAELEKQRAAALLQSDAGALDRITSDSYVHIESNGRLRSKAEFLADLRDSVFRFESFVVDRNDIRLFGSCAVVHGHYHAVIRTPNGVAPTKFARHIRVYALEDDAWRNVSHQATEIPRGSAEGRSAYNSPETTIENRVVGLTDSPVGDR